MNPHSWLSKFDWMTQQMRDIAVTHWEFAFGISCMAAFLAILVAAKKPEAQEKFKAKARIFRYCGDCPHCDLLTETCAMSADHGEKCGLVCKSSGFTFTVTKN